MDYLLTFSASFFLALLLVPLVKKLAYVIDIVDHPNPDNPGQFLERLAVVFIPPDPTVFFRIVPTDLDSTASEVSIILRVKDDPTKTKTITINKAGLITVE